MKTVFRIVLFAIFSLFVLEVSAQNVCTTKLIDWNEKVEIPEDKIEEYTKCLSTLEKHVISKNGKALKTKDLDQLVIDINTLLESYKKLVPYYKGNDELDLSEKYQNKSISIEAIIKVEPSEDD